jgi:hypothetical protein
MLATESAPATRYARIERPICRKIQDLQGSETIPMLISAKRLKTFLVVAPLAPKQFSVQQVCAYRTFLFITLLDEPFQVRFVGLQLSTLVVSAPLVTGR